MALALTAAVAVALVMGARAYGDAWAIPAGRVLAVVIAAGFVVEQITYALRDQWTAKYNLPLQLTDAVTLTAIAALWRPDRRLLVELVYFWAFSASLQAVVTPDLNQAFPDILYFTYFATHSGAIAAAALLVFGMRRTPRPGAVWRGVRRDRRLRVPGRRRHPHHRRQLHVPAAQAGSRLAPGPHGPMAALHPRRRPARAGHVHRTGRAGTPDRATRQPQHSTLSVASMGRAAPPPAATARRGGAAPTTRAEPLPGSPADRRGPHAHRSDATTSRTSDVARSTSLTNATTTRSTFLPTRVRLRYLRYLSLYALRATAP